MYEENKTFWQKKGFYLSLCGAFICILAIGTVYYNMHSADKGGGETLFADSAAENGESRSTVGGSAVSSGKDQDGQQVAAINNSEDADDKSASDGGQDDDVLYDDEDGADDEDESKKPVVKTQEKKSSKKADAKTSAKSSQDKKKTEQDSVPTIADSRDLKFDVEKGLLWPVKGDILLKYSTNNTVYFKTLAQYRCNPAVIIAAESGKKVKSAADGIVTKISEEFDIGKTVTMNIGSGYSVTYGQLTDISVKEGQSVKEGDIIGKVAEPTKYYSQEGSNLYFQVKENKETVDPMLLLR